MTLDRDRVAAALPAYEIGSELGRGGWGIVLAGNHRQLGRDVAIKELPRAFAGDPSVRGRFVAEARLLASLDHPHIVPVYDFVEHEGLCLLVMEQLPGGTVWEEFCASGFIAERACAVVLAACTALHFAHQRGILHRDVKPENLMYTGHGVVKVTDFGIAKVIGGGGTVATLAGDILGTPAYMAPEQAQGGELSPATDVYAVGTMLYELLSGHLPHAEEGDPLAVLYRHVFEDPTPLRDVMPAVPGPIAVAVMRSLERDPTSRQQSADQLGIELAQAATVAWGPGWLNTRSGVAVMAAGEIVAVTERTTGGAPLATEIAAAAPSTVAPAAVGRAPATVTPGTVAPATVAPAAPGRAPATIVPSAAPVLPSVAAHASGAAVNVVEDDVVPVQEVLSPYRSAALELARRVTASATRLDRSDLADRLRVAVARTARPATIVCVVGEFKQGKSSLVNALLGHHVCPVDDDLATSAITLVRQGEEPSVEVRRRVEAEVVVESVPSESIIDWVTEAGNPDNAKDVERLEVSLPNALLADGLCIVDTPGMGSLGAGHAAATLSFLPFADGLVFATDASAELSEPEVDFLKRARELCPNVVVALTKIDIYPHWREILDLDIGHLARIGYDAPVVPLSSELRWAALERSDRELKERSGYSSLLTQLLDSIIRPAKSVAAARAVHESLGALEQLRSSTEAELAVIGEPDLLELTVERAEEANARLESLRDPASRWSVLVSDRVADLSNDVTHRFQGHMRRIVRTLEDAIEEIKKPKDWDDLARVLQTEIADAVTDTFVRMDHGGMDIHNAVVELLAEEALQLAPLPAAGGEAVEVRTVWSTERLDADQPGAEQSGITMFGMIGRLLPAGVGLLVESNPVSLGIGAEFGGMQLVDAHKRKVAQRRQQARQNVRQFVDDVQFEVGNQITEVLRGIQRALRDELTEQITELQRTYTQTARQVQATGSTDGAAQQARGTELKAMFDELTTLRDTAVALQEQVA